MNHRALTTSLLLAVAACTPTSSAPSTTLPTTTTTTIPAPDPVEARYEFSAGDSLTYDVSASQNIMFDARGDAADLADETLPIDADLVSENTGSTTYTVESASGSTIAIHITATFDQTEIMGTVNGATIDDVTDGGVAVDLSRIQPVAVTVMIDSLGRLLDDGSDVPPTLGADIAALAGVTNDLFSVPVGPVFPDRAVTTGDTWQTSSERPGQQGPVTVTSRSEVTDHSSSALVVSTDTTTGAYSVDFSEQFRELFRAFSELEGEDVPPELTAQLEEILFRITVEESVTTEIAEFDVSRGVVRSSAKTSTLRLHMEFRAPDEDQQVRGFEILLDVEQTAVFSLRD